MTPAPNHPPTPNQQIPQTLPGLADSNNLQRTPFADRYSEQIQAVVRNLPQMIQAKSLGQLPKDTEQLVGVWSFSIAIHISSLGYFGVS